MSKTIRCEVASVLQDVFHKSYLLVLFENGEDAIHDLCSSCFQVAKMLSDKVFGGSGFPSDRLNLETNKINGLTKISNKPQ